MILDAGMMFIVAISLQLVGGPIAILCFFGNAKGKVYRLYFERPGREEISDHGWVTLERDELREIFCKLYLERFSQVCAVCGLFLSIFGEAPQTDKMYIVACAIIMEIALLEVVAVTIKIFANLKFPTDAKMSREDAEKYGAIIGVVEF